MKTLFRVSLVVVTVAALLLSACAPPTPVVVEKEVVVEKPVVETVVVEKEVVVTPTPVPPQHLHIATGSGRYLCMAKYATRWFAEQYGIELEWSHWAYGVETETAMTLLASDNPPDIFDTDYPELFYYAGATIPLNDLIEAWPDKDAYPEHFINMHALPDGTITGLSYSWPHPTFTIYRKDWLEKVGLDVPETVEDFYEVAKAFTFEDPDGNGVDDTFGFAWHKNFVHPMISPLYYAFGGRWLKIEDGEYVPGFTGEEGRKFLSLLVKMFEEGIIPKTSLELDDTIDPTRELVLAGQVGMIFEAVGSLTWMDSVIGPGVLEPTYPPTDGEHMGAGASWPLVTWVISRSAEDPELAWKWFEWFYSEQGQHQLTYGYEGIQYDLGPDGVLGVDDYIIPPAGPKGDKPEEYFVIIPKEVIARKDFEFHPFTEEDPAWWRPYMEKPGKQHEIIKDITDHYIVHEIHPNWPLYAETVSKWFAKACMGLISVDEAIDGAAKEVEERGILKIGE